MLERHLDWVGACHRFVSLDELGGMLENGVNPARPVAAVTFDDGYQDFYHHAFPLLKRKGIPATVFVVTDLIGTRRMQVHDRLYRVLAAGSPHSRGSVLHLIHTLDRLGIRRLAARERLKQAFNSPFARTRALLETLPQAEILRLVEKFELESGISEDTGPEPLSWEMVEEIHRAGMTIASHTRTHAFLTNESPERVYQEVAGSREALSKRLGITVRHFAYPDGRFDDMAVSAVAQAGYRFAYTTCLHRKPAHPLLTIPRKGLWENSCLDAHGSFSSAIMSCQVNRTFDLIAGACEVNHNSPAPATG